MRLSVVFSTEQTGKFLTDAENCLLKVQNHADIHLVILFS